MKRLKRDIFYRTGAGFAAGAFLVLAGCSVDAVNPEYRPADGNAVQSPYDIASPGDEVISRQSGAMPLVSLDLPNNANEQPKVETVLDFLKPPPTQPATRPSPVPGQSPVPTEILSGPLVTRAQTAPALPVGQTPQAAAGPVKVVGQGKEADQFTVAADLSGAVDVNVNSPSGIGSVTLEKTGDTWPAVIRVRLSYSQGKPFTNLEGFSASELTAGGREIPLKTAASKQTGAGTVTIPGFTRSDRIQIEWVDAYR